MCKRIFKNETSDSGDIPFYKIGTFGGKADAFISNEKYDYYKSKFSYPNKGDILLSASGTIGRIVEYTGEKAYFQDSNIVWLNHNEDIKNVFLKVLYPTVKWDGIEGSTIKRLYNSNFLNTCINIPNTLEQEKIGDLFTNLDNLITLHQRKSIDFLHSWEQRKLKKMTLYKNGTGHEDKQSSNGRYELINLNSVSIDGGLKSSGKFIDDSNETLKKNDLVMVLSDVGHGDLLGRVALIPTNNKFVLNQRVALLRPNGTINPRFLFTCINAGQNYFKMNGAGSSQLNISREVVEKFEPFVPKKEEQQKISTIFESLDNLITLHQHKELKRRSDINEHLRW